MAEQKTNWQVLAEVQQELKAPKGQYNSFGNYKYRSAEDILEAVKPVLAKHGATITLSDTLELIGDRYYIKATASFWTGAMPIQVTAYAREDDQRKGMSLEQQTGSCSSYARKYALNGLLLIDDTKDSDTDEYHTQTTAKSRQKPQIADNSNNLSKTEPVAKKRYFCDVCGKEVSEAYALKSIAKCGHIYCSAECKTKGDNLKEETNNA